MWTRAVEGLLLEDNSRDVKRYTMSAREPGVVRHWQRLVVDALAQRRAVTKHQWASSVTRPLEVPEQRPSDDVAPARAAARPARAAS